ncbi:MAG: hypothetical protein JNK75_13065 [Betaproteobacteria bacterium]|nr:hypothetical protein [Betaproteobacteria bacterium]
MTCSAGQGRGDSATPYARRKIPDETALVLTRSCGQLAKALLRRVDRANSRQAIEVRSGRHGPHPLE